MLLVYAPVTHWLWGGGFLADGGIFGAVGAKDFAGGIVVHETAALRRCCSRSCSGQGRTAPRRRTAPAMWRSELACSGSAGSVSTAARRSLQRHGAMAITVTHISAAAASMSWALWERIKFGRSSLVGIVTGTVAGLASITPASGYVGPAAALLIGAIAGVLCQEQ